MHTPQNDGELALVLMDQDALRAALQEIAYQTHDMTDKSQRDSLIMVTLMKHIPADKQAQALELLKASGERESWLANQLQIASKVVAGALELAHVYRDQRDHEVRLRVQAEGERDALVSRLENGDTDHPLLEQFLSTVMDGYADLE